MARLKKKKSISITPLPLCLCQYVFKIACFKDVPESVTYWIQLLTALKSNAQKQHRADPRPWAQLAALTLIDGPPPWHSFTAVTHQSALNPGLNCAHPLRFAPV